MKHLNLKKVLSAVIALTMIVCCALINADAKVILRGDVDGSGDITAADARLALRAAAALDKLDDAAFIAADVDESGEILAGDARTILRVSASLESFENPEIMIEDDEPTTEEPTTEDPTTEEPTTEEPTTEEPTTEEPTTEEPTTEEPTTEEPTTQEPTTEEPTTQEPTTDNGKVSYPKAIDGLFENHYYMVLKADGTSGGIARNGNDVEFNAAVDGLEMAIYVSGDSIYLKYDVEMDYGIFGKKVTNYYYKMSQSDLANMGADFNIEKMLEEYDFGSATDYKEVVSYNETLSGVEYTVYAFITEEGTSLCFYADANDNIKALCTKDAQGNTNNDITYIDVLSYDIPGGMCSIKGRTNDLLMTGLMQYMSQSGLIES